METTARARARVGRFPSALHALHALEAHFGWPTRRIPRRSECDPVAARSLDLLHSSHASGAIVDALATVRARRGSSIWDPMVADAEELLGWADWLGITQAILRGRETGHEWHACDRCGRGVLRARGKELIACRMRPGCDGKHRPPSR